MAGLNGTSTIRRFWRVRALRWLYFDHIRNYVLCRRSDFRDQEKASWRLIP
jgi:hypothetical protein